MHSKKNTATHSFIHPNPIHNAFSLLDHSTSDHSFQKVKVLDDSGLAIRAVTWNTMDKCHSVSTTKPYTNNPMNIDENLNQYKSRKLEQFKKLFKLIKEAPADKPIDSIFLQEIDWTRMLQAEVKGTTDKVQKELCDLFLKELKQLGWGFVLSPRTPSGAPISQQTLMTLYNKSSLTLVDGSGFGVLPSGSIVGQNQRFRGYQMTFTHRSTGKPIDLVNFHLNYEHDHRDDLIQVMEDSIANGHMVVMGGDANHPPNFAMDTLTGDWDTATAADKDDNIFKATGQIVMTTHHIGTKKKNIAKHYDGFSAGSPHSLRIIKEEGEHFEMVHNKVRLVRDRLDANHSYHQSEAGYPWIRGRALMMHLDNKLGRASGREEQHKILNQMQAIAKARFNESLNTAALHKKYPLVNLQKVFFEHPEFNARQFKPVPIQTKKQVPNPVDLALQSLQFKNIMISAQVRRSLKEVMDRLQYGSTAWNPYYMNSGVKLDKIIKAVYNLRSGSNFQKEFSNPQSELYKAINMQRISPFTLFGAFGFNQSKSLMKLNEAVHQQSNKLR